MVWQGLQCKARELRVSWEKFSFLLKGDTVCFGCYLVEMWYVTAILSPREEATKTTELLTWNYDTLSGWINQPVTHPDLSWELIKPYHFTYWQLKPSKLDSIPEYIFELFCIAFIDELDTCLLGKGNKKKNSLWRFYESSWCDWTFYQKTTQSQLT